MISSTSRPDVHEGLQGLDDNGHVGPEVGLVLDAQRRHRRELHSTDEQPKHISRTIME